MNANDNDLPTEYEAHAGRMIDEALALGEDDIGTGPLEPRTLLIAMAAQCIARAVLAFEVDPQEATDLVCGLAANIMLQEGERSEARMPHR